MTNRTEFANRMRRLSWAPAGMLALALLGCAHGYRLVPKPDEPATQGPGQAVAGESAGVRIVASAEIWNGDPVNLAQYVLPVWIEIENHSGKALWLRYSGLRLVGGRVALLSIPPYRVNGNAIMPAAAARAEARPEGFYVAPLLGPSYNGLDDPWQSTLLEADMDYHLAHSWDWEEAMPTADMIRKALPEGVVEDGDKVAGFVYFQKVKKGVKSLTLRGDLIDVTTKQHFGEVDIPFAVVKD